MLCICEFAARSWRLADTGNEEYWNHTSPCWHCGVNFTALDLHDATSAGVDKPVRDKVGQYSAGVFTDRAVDIIGAHDPSQPLFLYLPYESVHGAASCDPDCDMPAGDLLQAPQRFIDEQSHIKNLNRRTFAGMVGALDEAVRNVTDALKARGMWDETLLVCESLAVAQGSRPCLCARRQAGAFACRCQPC